MAVERTVLLKLVERGLTTREMAVETGVSQTNIWRWARGLTRPLAELRREARKCVLLCANCHAEVESGLTALPCVAVEPIDDAVA